MKKIYKKISLGSLAFIAFFCSFYLIKTDPLYAKDLEPNYADFIIQNGHSQEITALAADPKGKFFISGSLDKKIKLWSSDGYLLRVFLSQNQSITALAFHKSGQYFISGYADKTIALWHVNGKLIQTFQGHIAQITTLSFHPNGKYFLSGSRDKTIKIWDLKGKLIRTIEGHKAEITALCFHPNGKYFLSGSRDKTIKIWDLNGKLIRNIEGHIAEITGLAFHPIENLFLSAAKDKSIQKWDFQGKLIQTITGHGDAISALAIHPNGNIFFTGSKDQTIRAWSIMGHNIYTLKDNTKWALSLTMNKPCNRLVMGFQDNQIKIGNLKTNSWQSFQGHQGPVSKVLFLPNGREFLSASDDKTIKLWDIRGFLISTFRGHKKGITCVAVHPDDKRFLSGSRDNTIKLWTKGGLLLRTFFGHNARVNCLAFSPDGKIIVSGANDQTIKIWTIDGKLLRSIKVNEEGITSLAFHPLGKFFASGSFDGKIKLWRLDGVLIKEKKLHEGAITKLIFIDQGEKILSSSWDNTIKLLAIDKNKVTTFNGHTSWVVDLSFNQDRKQVISASMDSSVKIWDLNSKRQLTLVNFPENSMAILNEKGQFDFSGKGYEFLGITQGTKHYELLQFWKKFYQPNLIERFILGKIPRHPKDSLIRDLTSLPQLSMNSSSIFLEAKSNSITLGLRPDKRKRAVGKIFLYHNGRVIEKNKPGAYIYERRGYQYFRIDLLPGLNTFQGGAFDKSETLEGRSPKLFVHYKPRSKASSSLYIISFNPQSPENDDTFTKLANDNAKRFIESMRELGSTSYKNIQMLSFSQSDSTRQMILKKLQDISKSVKPEDTLIFFVSGKIMTAPGDFYLLLHTTDISNPGAFIKSAITLKDFHDFIQNLPAAQVAIFMEAYQSNLKIKLMELNNKTANEEFERSIGGLARNNGINVFAIFNPQSNHKDKSIYNESGNFIHYLDKFLHNREYRALFKEDVFRVWNLGRLMKIQMTLSQFQDMDIKGLPIFYFLGDDFILGRKERTRKNVEYP